MNQRLATCRTDESRVGQRWPTTRKWFYRVDGECSRKQHSTRVDRCTPIFTRARSLVIPDARVRRLYVPFGQGRSEPVNRDIFSTAIQATTVGKSLY